MAACGGPMPGLRGAWENSVMSAPAMNVRPSQISTIAVASLASAAAMPSSSPSRTWWLRAFTGGLFTMSSATSSRRSSRTDSVIWLCSWVVMGRSVRNDGAG